jgi:hypothetical protein
MGCEEMVNLFNFAAVKRQGAFEKNRAEAARWLQKNETPSSDDGRFHFWRWHVLTDKNTAPNSMKLCDGDASLIFADLVHEGLLVECLDNNGQGAHRINPGKKADWSKISYPGWHRTLLVMGYLATLFVGYVIGKL